MPADLLPLDSEVIARLRLFGLTRIGEVAALSHLELQSQFGFAGKRIWQLVNGIDEERLRPRARAETLSGGLSFDAPVAGIDVMIAVTRQLLSRLRPALRGRAARELTLQAELASNRGWERRLVFREAVSEDERLFFVLRSSLQNAPPPQAVRSFSLRLGGLTGETGKQLSLGERGRLQRQLEEAIRQLKARYGYSPVYRCVDVESWSVIPEERQILVESDA
jgi:DNA polymerase-4/protein ImuB